MHLVEKERGEENREEGLHGLDSVREGDCHLEQAHVREHSSHRVHGCQQPDHPQVLNIYIHNIYK
jgi:hypothetical protein